MNKKNFDWGTEQAGRFQEFLNNCEKELSDEQLDETLEDFINFEEEEGEMTLDTFKERLSIVLRNANCHIFKEI